MSDVVLRSRPLGSRAVYALLLAAAARPAAADPIQTAANSPGPEGHNPAGLIAGLEVESEGRPIVRVGTDAPWRSTPEAGPGWREVEFDDSPWPAARELGPPGTPPWGPFHPRDPIPPLAIGLAEGPRVFYMLDARPALLQGLTPGRSYRVREFDPVAGTARDAGSPTADPSGQAHRAPPTPGHDWVHALIPEPAPAQASPP